MPPGKNTKPAPQRGARPVNAVAGNEKPTLKPAQVSRMPATCDAAYIVRDLAAQTARMAGRLSTMLLGTQPEEDGAIVLPNRGGLIGNIEDMLCETRLELERAQRQLAEMLMQAQHEDGLEAI